jgi:hypothetical protein
VRVPFFDVPHDLSGIEVGSCSIPLGGQRKTGGDENERGSVQRRRGVQHSFKRQQVENEIAEMGLCHLSVNMICLFYSSLSLHLLFV